MFAAGLPKISLVTPSYNYGHFIEQTIETVLSQHYPDLEYMVLDGGSVDHTVDIIRKYERQLAYWHSQRDSGPAEAIEKARRMSTGTLFNWLNADDYLLPETLIALGTIAQKYPHFDIYAFLHYGEWLDGSLHMHIPEWPPDMTYELVSCRLPFAQESTFVRNDFLNKHQIAVRAEFQHMFDTILYSEMAAKGARVLFVQHIAGVMRYHPESKTSKGIPQRDLAHAQAWEQSAFSLRQRLWRRINGSRFATLQQKLCHVRRGRVLLEACIGRKVQPFALCRAISQDYHRPEAWEMMAVGG
jgi:glycosyltransferase involved in cell wall biosynthesis